MNGYTQLAKLAIVLLSIVSIGLLAWVIFEAVAIHNETPPSTPSATNAMLSAIFANQQRAYREKRTAEQKEKAAAANLKLAEEKQQMKEMPPMAPPKVRFDLSSMLAQSPPGALDAPHLDPGF